MLSGLVLAVQGTGGPDELARRRLREGGKQHLPTGILIRERRWKREEGREKREERREKREERREKREERREKREERRVEREERREKSD